ncbi:hypothetical protein [Actinomadura sp. 6N118]|uniref:hypothetical protein n=1 Tax=Actinomadura sp. 6N118 TaxID=3375151 RepID=UPI0037BC7D6D
MSTELVAVLISTAVSLVVSVLSITVNARLQDRHLREQIRLDEKRLQAEIDALAGQLREGRRQQDQVDRAIRQLLVADGWDKRSFTAIKRRIGGFSDDELRRLLITAGAHRYESRAGEEYWGFPTENPNTLAPPHL